jgi:hypothetical protein
VIDMSQFRLGVLAMYLPGKRLEERSFYRKLCIYGKRLGIEPVVFTPDDVDTKGQRVFAQTYDPATKRWQRLWVPFPSLIYDRCRYHGIDNFHKLTQFRNRHGKLRYMSRPLVNKWGMHQILSESSTLTPYLPHTIKYRSSQDLSRMLKQHRLLYLKPRSGTGGRGIVRIEKLGTNLYQVQGRDQQRRIITPRQVTEQQIGQVLSGWPLVERYIIQQGIPLTLKDGRVHDFRMLVQKNGEGEWEITGCAGRIGPHRSVTSNLHGGGTAIPMEKLLRHKFTDPAKIIRIKQTAYKMGIETVKFLDTKFDVFCEVGLDIAVDPSGHVWILEVNPKPSREVFSRIGEQETYRRAITRPLEFALFLQRGGKPGRTPVSSSLDSGEPKDNAGS